VIISPAELDSLVNARCANPHDVLGMHRAKVKGNPGVVVRAFLRGAQSCQLVAYEETPERRFDMLRIEGTDLFELFLPEHKAVFAYRLREVRANGEIRQFYDPYCFLPTLSEDDLYLFNKGEQHRVYDKLGAHMRTLGEVQGASFAVWAPSARRVSVVGDFNAWDGRFHPMRPMGASGIWEIFIPGLERGTKYKFEIYGADGQLHLKSDPYALRYEAPPHNASILWDIADYRWGDAAWMAARTQGGMRQKPFAVFELHLGSWKRVLEQSYRLMTYREAAQELVKYIRETGFTHVEFMPLSEHPFDGSWGYQVTGFYAPTHRFGTPQDFMYLVDTLHQNGIGVLMDWVPAHFPKDDFALARFDGSCLYEHADPRQGEHMDWGTLIFNYGRYEVRDFLTGSALAWMDRYHIDGLRVDAVASMLYLDYSRKDGQWIPNRYGGRENIEAIEFLRHTNDLVHLYYPGALMIAEESTAFGGVTKSTKENGLGFDFKWNMGWMHDTLSYFQKDPLYRNYHHDQLTFPMIYQYTEAFVSVLSHDEVVHGKGSLIQKMGSWNMKDKARTLRVLFALMWLWPGKKTLFMGCEWGQLREWKYDEALDWHLLEKPEHGGTRHLVCDLNALYTRETSFAHLDDVPEGFQWIDCHDAKNSVISFLRVSADKPAKYWAVVCNLTPIARERYRVGLPVGGRWREIINTNSALYDGLGEGNLGGVEAEALKWNNRPYSAEIFLPGLSVVAFQFGEDAPVTDRVPVLQLPAAPAPTAMVPVKPAGIVPVAPAPVAIAPQTKLVPAKKAAPAKKNAPAVVKKPSAKAKPAHAKSAKPAAKPKPVAKSAAPKKAAPKKKGK